MPPPDLPSCVDRTSALQQLVSVAILCGIAATLIVPPAAASEQDDSEPAEPANVAKDAGDSQSADDAESSAPPELRVTTVAEPAAPAEQSRLPSGWVSSLELDETFARGADLGRELEQIEGVTVRRRSGLGQPAFATVRGGSPRQLAVHLNGIRIGAPAGIGFDVGTLSTQSLDSVDVYRGGAAAPWGSGALTGAMNLRMRPPEDDGWSTAATTMAGSFGTVGLSAQAAGSGEDLRGDVAASWRRSRGDFDFVDAQGTEHTRINNGHRQIAGGATIGTTVGGGDLSGALLHEDVRRGAPGPSEFQESYRHATLESRRTIGTVDWDQPAIGTPDWGVLDLKLAAGGVHRPLHYSNPDGFLGGVAVDNESSHSTLAARSRLSGYFDAGNIAHLDLEIRTQHFDADYGWGGDASLTAQRQTAAVGLSDELLLFDEAVSLIGGLRAGLVSGRDRVDLPVVPSGGIIWRALDAVRLKANLARSHRVPDFDELYLRTEAIRGNPELDDERALNADIGAEFGRREGPARGKITLYYSDLRDMILFVPQTAYLVRAENLSNATSRGVEASGSLDITGRFQIRGSYTYTDAFLDSLPVVQLPHHPAHRGLVSTGAEFAGLGPLDALRSFKLTSRVSARSSVNLDNFGSLTNPPFAQLDLGATVRPSSTLTFGLEVQNVTDNRRGADFLQRPLPGRALYASVRLRDGTLPP
jgi:iron complex outermembrane receptor protein